MDADTLRQYLEFYQDLGIKNLYRQAAVAVPVPEPVALRAPAPVETLRPEVEAKPMTLPPLTPPGETLLQIIQDIGDCRRCRLHEGRTKIVFGVGNEQLAAGLRGRRSGRR